MLRVRDFAGNPPDPGRGDVARSVISAAMTKNRKRILMVWIAAALVAGAALLHWTLVAGRCQHLQALQEEESILRSGQNIDQLREDVIRLRSDVGQRRAQMQDDAATFLQELAIDLNRLNVADRSLTTGTPCLFGSVQQMALNLTFKGSFKAVFELLRRFDD